MTAGTTEGSPAALFETDPEIIRARFREEQELFRSNRDASRLIYTAQLPGIIGYVPEAEREFFRTHMPNGRQPDFQVIKSIDAAMGALREGLPGTFSQIDETFDWLGEIVKGVKLDYVVFDRNVSASNKARAARRKHVDPPGIVLGDRLTTRLFTGPAELVPRRGYANLAVYPGVKLDLKAGQVVSPPPYALMLMSALSVHGRPPELLPGNLRTVLIGQTYVRS